MLSGTVNRFIKHATAAFRAYVQHNRTFHITNQKHRPDPFSRILLGTTSTILFSTGLILCDSSSSASVTTAKISKASEEQVAQQRRGNANSQNLESECAFVRLKSGFQDVQNKLSEFETPSISPEIRLPPHFLDWVEKIRAHLSFSEGSVSDEIWKESQDSAKNPEIEKDAKVWIGNQLCDEELAFYGKRKEFTRIGLAKYLDVDVDEIDERDIPTIAIAGSGGGYRAMLGTTGYFKAMKDAGLFDCVTYMAGNLKFGLNEC